MFHFFLHVSLQNLLHVKEVKLPNCFGGIGYLGFEKLTFVPIQVSRHIVIFLFSYVFCNAG